MWKQAKVEKLHFYGRVMILELMISSPTKSFLNVSARYLLTLASLHHALCLSLLILQKPTLINQFFKDGFALNYWDAYFCTTNSEWRVVLQCLSFYVDFAETYFDHFFKGFVHWSEMHFVLTGTLSEPDSPLSCWNPFCSLQIICGIREWKRVMQWLFTCPCSLNCPLPCLLVHVLELFTQ